MTEFVADNWLWVAIALLVALALAFLLLRPKQRVELTDSGTPVRPHMQQQPLASPRVAPVQAREGRGLTDEVAAATGDVTGEILDARVRSQLPGASGPPDDLQKLKGVGPKLAEMLQARGITRYEQIAKLTPGEVERLESSFGAFRGRIERDRIVEQAEYLARGDVDGFEHRFGKL